ncbi:hypothetical protein ACIF6I_31585 [Streptomyces microflavus]
MARMNHELAGVETIFIAANPALAHISSTLVTTMKCDLSGSCQCVTCANTALWQ